MSTEILSISAKKYRCNDCLITCHNNTEWKRHINTNKHKINQTHEIGNKKSTTYDCDCGKTYKERSGLWRHKKKCIFVKNEVTEIQKEIQTTTIINDNE